MPVTLKDVAELAGVSRSAVSRTFTEGASVSAKTRAKVEAAANKLGYSPNVLARSLTTRRTKLIGLISNNFHNPVFLQVFDLFTRTLQTRGFRPLLVNLSDETDPGKSLQMMRQYSVDGVIVASSTLPPAFSRAFHNAQVPVVHAFGRFTDAPDVHIVGVDNRHCGILAAEHLLALGYQHIGFLGGPASATTTMDRWDGFKSVADKHSSIMFSHSFAAAYSFDAGRAEMTRLLNNNPAKAYFCGDDVLSLGAISAIRSAGLAVPEDIGVLGMNDMEMAAWAGIELSTIHQPISQIIASSVELIIAILEQPDRYPEARLFPCHIVERKTLPKLTKKLFQKQLRLRCKDAPNGKQNR